MTLSICFSPPEKRNLFIHLSISHGLYNIYLKQTKITTLQQSWFFSKVETLEKSIKSLDNLWNKFPQNGNFYSFRDPWNWNFKQPTWPSKQMFYLYQGLATFEKFRRDKRTITFFWGSPNPQNKVFIF